MFLKIARDFSRPHWFDIVNLLKRSTGMSVGELSKALKMSYMGIKQHCIDMEKKGYLDTWRRPKPMGRPEKVYRLTPKANALFPQVGAEFSLEILRAVRQVYGPTAPDKLLFQRFQKESDRYAAKVKGTSIADRATRFAKLRDAEGFCSECEFDRSEGGLVIVEYHTPLGAIADEFPSVHKMEEAMFGRVLRSQVTRYLEKASGLTRICFRIATL